MTDELWHVLSYSPYVLHWRWLKQALLALGLEEVEAAQWSEQDGAAAFAIFTESDIPTIRILVRPAWSIRSKW